MDRISPLPDPILHRILCYLSTKQAFQICTVSKSWRYVCSARPNFELRESFFNGDRQAFFSFLETALTRYRDRNISLPEFLLEISSKLDSEFVPLLQTWIPVVLLGMAVKKFTLNFTSDDLVNCDLHSLFHFHLAATVFQAETLEELHLTGCDFSRINHTKKVMFNHLRKLSLSRVHVSDLILERIISSCPLIEHVAINQCDSLRAIKVNNALNLKCFDFVGVRKSWFDFNDSCSIEIDAPYIECMRISKGMDWLHSTSYSSFSRLKSLHLSSVLLCENSFHILSVDFCSLEELTLRRCFGFEQFKLASSSLKNLSLYVSKSNLRKAAIDVPNIRSFEVSCVFLPSISFTTVSSEWKSKIIVEPFGLEQLIMSGPSSILLDIYELHKAALCHSEFSLHITNPFGFSPENGVGSPVVVEKLTMDANISVFPLRAWLGNLFGFFRPRNIEHFWSANPENDVERVDNLLVEGLREFLVEDEQQGLEQVLEESCNERGKKAECGLLDNGKQKIRFRLKWRELGSFA